MKTLTFKYVKESLEAVGISIRKEFGEYQVRVKGLSDAYFTDDLKDAFDTGIEISKTK